MQPSVGLPPPLRNANNILLPAKGGVMAQMRRIFYWRIKLAILLIGRPVATMLPQAAHRQATLAARRDIRPSRWIRGPAQRMQNRRRHARPMTAQGRRPAPTSHLHALLGEIFERTRMPRDRRVLQRLALERDVLCLGMHDRELVAVLGAGRAEVRSSLASHLA